MGHSRHIGYHGITRDGISQPIRTPFYLAHSRELADEYAEGGTVLAFEYHPRNALLLESPEAFREAWIDSGASIIDGPFHPDQTHVFCGWAISLGHDCIIIPESAFEGELGYELVAGTVGEPQTIVLNGSILRRVE